ncbi:Streptogramin A acetyltransferase [Rubripirellula tenax]|uniref:Streptogramin A acetyltransferase n=1 Tax=Rubripirellula tenax TaxID=2528015 RepID=A0A5C6EXX5_9BACT|nr:Streptogramin A acetyltransferase [Rubripirellula tenax]
MLREIKREYREWLRAVLRGLPGRTGERARRKFYGFDAPNTSRVLSNVTIYHPENLRIGNHSAISTYCQLNAKSGIEIGNDVLIGPGSFIWSQNHNFTDTKTPVRLQGYSGSRVVIGDDVWIAARCVILPGVHLATGTIVAAGAVVTKSTKPYSIVAGTPAVQVGSRKDSDSNGGASEPGASS